eukprot:GILK01004604.1.p1 GENE.GILK01004604.1~~GILK01004604.1.p1  ORF type:complete len:613 (+),score=134.01 GILK01004604.1:63-1901(+)
MLRKGVNLTVPMPSFSMVVDRPQLPNQDERISPIAATPSRTVKTPQSVTTKSPVVSPSSAVSRTRVSEQPRLSTRPSFKSELTIVSILLKEPLRLLLVRFCTVEEFRNVCDVNHHWRNLFTAAFILKRFMEQPSVMQSPGSRTLFWRLSTRVLSVQHQACRVLDINSASEAYKKLLAIVYTPNGLTPSGLDEIQRDVTRTFPANPKFAETGGSGQQQLSRILQAIAVYHKDIHYCQGMNFIVGALLYVVPEELAFWIMMSLIDNYDMKQMFLPGVPGLKFRIYHLDRLVAKHLPKLHAHFRRVRITPDFFASQWFMTLFSYYLPVETLHRIWDLFFVNGWKFLYRVAVGSLQLMEADLLPLDLEDMSEYLRRNKRKHHTEVQQLIEAAMQLKITRRELAQLDEDFKVAQLKEKLTLEGSQNDAVVLAAKQELGKVDGPFRDDIKQFKAKIEQVEKELASAQVTYQQRSWECQYAKTIRDELLETKDVLSSALQSFVQLTPARRISENVDSALNQPEVVLFTPPNAISLDKARADLIVFQKKIGDINDKLLKAKDEYNIKAEREQEARAILEEAMEKKQKVSEQLSLFLVHMEERRSEALRNVCNDFEKRGNI